MVCITLLSYEHIHVSRHIIEVNYTLFELYWRTQDYSNSLLLHKIVIFHIFPLLLFFNTTHIMQTKTVNTLPMRAAILGSLPACFLLYTTYIIFYSRLFMVTKPLFGHH